MSDNLSALAQSANAALEDPAPFIDSTPPTDVQLIKGLFNEETREWDKRKKTCNDKYNVK